MSDVNVIVDAAPVSVEMAAAPVAVNIAAAPVSIEVAAAPMQVFTQDAPIQVIISGARGPAGTVETSWFYLVTSSTEAPTVHGTIPVLGGLVYTYTYGTTIYYRHVPSPYDPTEDTFYETYAAGVLSDPITSKGIAI